MGKRRKLEPAAASARRDLGPVLTFMRSLWGANHALESASRRMKARYGVTGPERMVVRLVGRSPGIAAGELARTLQIHPGTLTKVLRRLVRRGLVRREGDASDGRRVLLTLGPNGETVDRLRRGTVEAGVRAALEALPPGDVQTAAAVLDAIAAALEA